MLFTQWYDDPETEIYRTECLTRNMKNGHIKHLHIFYENHLNALLDIINNDNRVSYSFISSRLSYRDWMIYADRNYGDDIKLLCNSDIFFDETLEVVTKLDCQRQTLYAISRKDYDLSGSRIVPSHDLFEDHRYPINPIYSQDCWLYKYPVLDSNTDPKLYYLKLGYNNCDRLLKDNIQKQNIAFVNLYPKINALHIDYRKTKKHPSYSLDPSAQNTKSSDKKINNTTQKINANKQQLIQHSANLYEIIEEWQQPNSTELHYFNNHKNFASKTSQDIVYIGYSWANHIDKKLTLDDSIIASIAKISSKKVTVCQHIRWKNLLDLWYKIGLDEIYVSHCTKNLDIYYPNIKPWSLYAVSVIAYPKPKQRRKRQYLASFVGCHRRDYRSKIRLQLNNYFHKHKHKKIYFALSDDWFYEKNIYHNQAISPEQIEQTQQYNEIISDSTFSLCPEGTGPNTIRLWESMALGSIPVIYSDDWLPPKISGMDWRDFSVFIPIKEYENTLDILTSIDQDKRKEMQVNCVVAFNKFNDMTLI